MAWTGSQMFCAVVVVLAVLSAPVFARPDSAGIVEMVNGLAYGGIPYGSVTGRVADYFRARGNVDGLGNQVYDVFGDQTSGKHFLLQRL